jgi:hypothetical protein
MRTLRVMIGLVAVVVIYSLPPLSRHVQAHSLSANSVPGYIPKRPARPSPPALNSFDPVAVEGVVDQFRLWQAGSSLTVCFFDGTQEQRKFIRDVAEGMLTDVNLTFNFGDNPTLRDCDSRQVQHIRIAFDLPSGNWSYIGTDSIRVDGEQPSMNLGDLAAATVLDSPSNRGLILHEFGHALALQHEHQSPAAGCDSEFDWETIYSTFQNQYGWDRQKVDTNIRSLKDTPRLRASPYDRTSIMHYYFPAWMYRNGDRSKCYVGHNQSLSATDRQVLRESYPSSAPSQLAEINKRADLAKHVLTKLLTTDQQRAWTQDLVEQAASTAAPGFLFSMNTTSIENSGQCSGANVNSTAGQNSLVVTCIDAGHDVNIGVPPPPPVTPQDKKD